MKIAEVALVIALLAILGCSASTPASPETYFSSTAQAPFFIEKTGTDLTFQFENRQCLASGVAATEQLKVTVPQSAVCNSAVGTTANWLGKGLGEIVSVIMQGLVN